MDLKFREFAASEREELADFLPSEEWEYHSVPRVSKDEAMREVLLQCGYVKEAQYRAADEGQRYGTTGYAILKRDWASGTTTPVDWDDEESLLE